MGDQLKWLLKEGGGLILECFDISLENTPTHCRCMRIFNYSCTRAQVLLSKQPIKLPRSAGASKSWSVVCYYVQTVTQ